MCSKSACKQKELDSKVFELMERRLQEEVEDREDARQQRLLEHETRMEERRQSWEEQMKKRVMDERRERELEYQRWEEQRKVRELRWEEQRRERELYWEELTREGGAPLSGRSLPEVSPPGFGVSGTGGNCTESN